MLMVVRGPENQTLEYTQYMPGSMHFEDHGKHLGETRISQHLMGATLAVKDLSAARAFYVDKLAFEPRAEGPDGVYLRLPGGSGDEVKLEPAGDNTKPGLFFTVPDLQRAAADLKSRGLEVKTIPGCGRARAKRPASHSETQRPVLHVGRHAGRTGLLWQPVSRAYPQPRCLGPGGSSLRSQPLPVSAVQPIAIIAADGPPPHYDGRAW
jgi:catechol 2,3-dioxygenase-like lactoylglutathione lyase family enzyme